MKYILFIIFLSTGILHAKSPEPIIIYDNPYSIKVVDQNIFILTDSQSIISLKNIQSNNNFKLSKLGLPNLGVSKYTHWLKFSIQNRTANENLLLQLSFPLLDTANLLSINTDGSFTEIQLGNNRPFKHRKYKNPNFIYDIHIKQNQSQTFYLKIHGNEQILVPITLGTPELMNESNTVNDILFGLYAGIIFVMIFYNLFIYFTVQDKSYLVYVLYILSIGMTQISLQGYGFKVFWPEFYEFNTIASTLFSAFGAIFAIEFLKIFLKTSVHTPTLHIHLILFESLFILTPLINLIGYKLLAFSIIQIATLFLCCYIFYIATKIALKGFRPAKFFLFAWVILMISTILFIFKDFDLFPYTFYTKYAMQIGSSLEVILLSFALADRINVLKKEKEESHALAFEALLQNELIIKNQNIILENKVDERTKELTDTIASLKQTQTQLVSSEKMASLGQLTAGIANEINNPINFVVSNVRPLKKDIEDIYGLIQKYENIDPLSTLQNKLSEINSFKKEIDYAFLKNEIGNLLKGIEDGAEKTADIMQELSIFSKNDGTEIKRVNIINLINSNLKLLNSEIRNSSIEVIRNFTEIPQIECFSGKLNQVFMNLLTNSIYAIKEKKHIEKGIISITSSADNYNVHISIKDNGTGISEDIKEKVFEPFFSTKEVGKGAGLGMSIALSIIHDHNGTIQLNTIYGEGSEFIITIPINNTKI